MDILALLPKEIREGIGAISKESPLTEAEFAQLKADSYNASPGYLEGVDCPVCHNKGRVMYVTPDGETRLKGCKCLAQRKSVRYLERSGLSKVLDTYTWERWQCKETWQTQALRAAQTYARHPDGWFLASGRPGTGKTHLCTAICGDLLHNGYEVRYLLWREFTTKAKALLTEDEEYGNLVDPYKRVPVLYLDDLFKTGKGQEPTTGDVNLAFELLNARYADPDKLTIISTELSMAKLLDIDEATGSRIYERARGHYLDLSEKKNWRLS